MDYILTDSLYYAFGKVMRMYYIRTHSVLDKIGLYPGQPPLLIALSHKDGQSQKELSERLRVKPATITVMIKRMEKSELLEKKSDEKDQRISRVYLTSKGREASRALKEIVIDMEEQCFKNLTQEERILLRRLLLQVADNLSVDVENEKDD